MQRPLALSFMKEKKEGKGEDSSPLSLVHKNHIYVGVFDGMGGSGASLYKTEDGTEHTGAYIASRVVCECVKSILEKSIESTTETTVLLKNLKENIQEVLRQEITKYQSKEKSALRSSLLRTFPTTMALCSCETNDSTICIDSIWAGDSRNYLLTDEGLFQISVDDLTPQQDPMENLKNDAPLSNCICADRDFKLNHQYIEIESPCCVISATDGCFGYSLSPMHFEALLLECLNNSKNVEEWSDAICDEINKITGDDFSFSAFILGCNDYKEFKDRLKKRKSIIEKTLKNCNNCISEIERYKKIIEDNETKLSDKKVKLEIILQEGWDKYKVQYMSKLSVE